MDVNVWHSETNPRRFIRVRCKEQLKGKKVLICVSNFNIQEGKGGYTTNSKYDKHRIRNRFMYDFVINISEFAKTHPNYGGHSLQELNEKLSQIIRFTEEKLNANKGNKEK